MASLSHNQYTALDAIINNNFMVNIDRLYDRSRAALVRHGFIVFDDERARYVATAKGIAAVEGVAA